MAEHIKAEERLARFAASLSPHMQLEMLAAMQGYHEQFYNELVAATTENVVRAQGKVQAMEMLNKTIQRAREIIATVDTRRFANKPPPDNSKTMGMM